ncbi:hypothetical protein K438DRAFT_1785532 [Mycena galopus ATCC 62051]|nr:hypothetical protein K438DRAFT_1785532 [Mycena galopus ATCC 62051]
MEEHGNSSAYHMYKTLIGPLHTSFWAYRVNNHFLEVDMCYISTLLQGILGQYSWKIKQLPELPNVFTGPKLDKVPVRWWGVDGCRKAGIALDLKLDWGKQQRTWKPSASKVFQTFALSTDALWAEFEKISLSAVGERNEKDDVVTGTGKKLMHLNPAAEGNPTRIYENMSNICTITLKSCGSEPKRPFAKFKL